MDNEPYRILGHNEARDTLAQCLREQKNLVFPEFELPDKKRADIFCVTTNGLFSIIEVKTEFKTSLIELALKKYARWCHALVFAVPGLTEDRLKPELPTSYWDTAYAKAGLVGVWPCSFVTLRLPVFTRLDRETEDILTELVTSSPVRR